MDEVECQIRQPRWKTALGFVGCVVFAVLSWWTKDDPEPGRQLSGWLGLALSATFSPFWLAATLRPATLSVSRQGIEVRSTFQTLVVDWPNVEEVKKRTYGWNLGMPSITAVELRLVRPQSVRRLLGTDAVDKVHLGPAWPISHDDLLARLVGAKSRFATKPPSRSADPVVM